MDRHFQGTWRSLTTPSAFHSSLMLLPSHEKVLRCYAASIRPISVAPSKVITTLFLPRDGPTMKVKLDVQSSFRHSLESLDSLSKRGRFGNITLPDWTVRKLESVVSENELEIETRFPRKTSTNFTYLAGVWLLLAIETAEPRFVSRWTRDTKARHPEVSPGIERTPP